MVMANPNISLPNTDCEAQTRSKPLARRLITVVEFQVHKTKIQTINGFT